VAALVRCFRMHVGEVLCRRLWDFTVTCFVTGAKRDVSHCWSTSFKDFQYSHMSTCLSHKDVFKD
jgi:hypothetical protein